MAIQPFFSNVGFWFQRAGLFAPEERWCEDSLLLAFIDDGIVESRRLEPFPQVFEHQYPTIAEISAIAKFVNVKMS